MKLPNPEKAFIDNQKLTVYSLNPNHEEGKHKALVFKPLTRQKKTAIIHSVWIVRNNENFPRLVTCYVL